MSSVPPFSIPLINGLSGPYTAAMQQGKAGAYGRNAAFNSSWVNQTQPGTMPQVHVQLSPHTPKTNTHGFLADAVAYSAEDMAIYDGKNGAPKDGFIDLNELTAVFQRLTPNVGTAQKLAVQWLTTFDTDLDFKINLSEHTASTLMELNPMEYAGRLQAAGIQPGVPSNTNTPAANAVIASFYNSGNTSTPKGREAKHVFALQSPSPTSSITQSQPPNIAQAVCAQLRASFNLDNWSDWYRQAWPQ
ncbi:MAG: EF-hand domain-containing protein [Vampirovibrionales bacterium]|nr:EF-hand domain-containing protein [Vampirovibrionales bacterium]